MKNFKGNRKKSGFTLAELLVVVAIIAILVAVAIPAFSAQRNKASKAVHESNARSFHAEATLEYLDDATKTSQTGKYSDGGTDVTYTWTLDTNATPAVATVKHTCKAGICVAADGDAELTYTLGAK